MVEMYPIRAAEAAQHSDDGGEADRVAAMRCSSATPGISAATTVTATGLRNTA